MKKNELYRKIMKDVAPIIKECVESGLGAGNKRINEMALQTGGEYIKRAVQCRVDDLLGKDPKVGGCGYDITNKNWVNMPHLMYMRIVRKYEGDREKIADELLQYVVYAMKLSGIEECPSDYEDAISNNIFVNVLKALRDNDVPFEDFEDLWETSMGYVGRNVSDKRSTYMRKRNAMMPPVDESVSNEFNPRRSINEMGMKTGNRYIDKGLIKRVDDQFGKEPSAGGAGCDITHPNWVNMSPKKLNSIFTRNEGDQEAINNELLQTAVYALKLSEIDECPVDYDDAKSKNIMVNVFQTLENNGIPFEDFENLWVKSGAYSGQSVETKRKKYLEKQANKEAGTYVSPIKNGQPKVPKSIKARDPKPTITLDPGYSYDEKTGVVKYDDIPDLDFSGDTDIVFIEPSPEDAEAMEKLLAEQPDDPNLDDGLDNTLPDDPDDKPELKPGEEITTSTFVDDNDYTQEAQEEIKDIQDQIEADTAEAIEAGELDPNPIETGELSVSAEDDEPVVSSVPDDDDEPVATTVRDDFDAPEIMSGSANQTSIFDDDDENNNWNDNDVNNSSEPDGEEPEQSGWGGGVSFDDDEDNTSSYSQTSSEDDDDSAPSGWGSGVSFDDDEDGSSTYSQTSDDDDNDEQAPSGWGNGVSFDTDDSDIQVAKIDDDDEESDDDAPVNTFDNNNSEEELSVEKDSEESYESSADLEEIQRREHEERMKQLAAQAEADKQAKDAERQRKIANGENPDGDPDILQLDTTNIKDMSNPANNKKYIKSYPQFFYEGSNNSIGLTVSALKPGRRIKRDNRSIRDKAVHTIYRSNLFELFNTVILMQKIVDRTSIFCGIDSQPLKNIVNDYEHNYLAAKMPDVLAEIEGKLDIVEDMMSIGTVTFDTPDELYQWFDDKEDENL